MNASMTDGQMNAYLALEELQKEKLSQGEDQWVTSWELAKRISEHTGVHVNADSAARYGQALRTKAMVVSTRERRPSIYPWQKGKVMQSCWKLTAPVASETPLPDSALASV